MTGAPGSRNLEGMNSIATHTAPISGLLSLVTDALDHEPSRTGTPTGPIAPPQAPDLSAVLGQLAGGWMAVKEDGHGWMLLQFAPRTEAAALAHASGLVRPWGAVEGDLA